MRLTMTVFLKLILLLGPLPVSASDRIATSLTVAGAKLSAAQITALDAAMRDEIEKQGVVGLAVGVIRDGQVVHSKAYGFEDRERGIPTSKKTLFRWASISKPVTAVCAMQLVEQGKLDLHRDAREYVPEFTDHGVTITPRLLLCHQGGIVHYRNGPVISSHSPRKEDRVYRSVMEALELFDDSPLVNAPGEKFAYSTHGYIYASAVVERAGKSPFARQVRDRIVRPLKLETLQPDYQWKELEHRAVGYRKRDGEIVRSTDTDVSWKLGGGGFISNIDDLGKFAAGLLGTELVGAETKRRMWAPQPTQNGSPTSYALGFGVSKSGQRISHSGAQEKTRTLMVIEPQTRSGYVIMTNSEYGNVTTFAGRLEVALEKSPGN